MGRLNIGREVKSNFMIRRYEYLGFLKLNNEEDGNNYKPGDYALFKFDRLCDRNLQIDKNGDVIDANISRNKIRSNFNDLTGKKFDKLKVRCLDKVKSAQAHRSYWICDCDCGNSKSICGSHLTRGLSTSCGCNHSYNTDDLTSKE